MIDATALNTFTITSGHLASALEIEKAKKTKMNKCAFIRHPQT